MPRDHRVHARVAGPVRRSLSQHYDGAVQRAYVASTRAIGTLMFLVGLAMIVSTLARGGGILALGVVLGVMLAAIGAARVWLARAHGGEA